MRHRSRTAGYTLIELMICVVIMSVMALATLPGLQAMNSERRQVAAQYDLMQIARLARDSKGERAFAHLLRFQQAASNDLGSFELYAGMGPKCTQTTWNDAFTAPTNQAQPASRLRAFANVNLQVYNTVSAGSDPTFADRDRPVIAYRAYLGNGTTAIPVVWICYQSNGEVYTMTASPESQTALLRQTQLIRFKVTRMINGADRGQTRSVIFPIGAQPRTR